MALRKYLMGRVGFRLLNRRRRGRTADGRGPSIWDMLSHRVPTFVVDNSTADFAASHYYLHKQDIARLASMGVPSFAFTGSWYHITPQLARLHGNDVPCAQRIPAGACGGSANAG